jgi:hypothetical protein
MVPEAVNDPILQMFRVEMPLSSASGVGTKRGIACVHLQNQEQRWREPRWPDKTQP